MGNNSRRIIKAITDHINRSRFLYNATTAIGNATERAQNRINHIHSATSEKCTAIVKQVNGSIMIQNLQGASIQSTPTMNRISHWWQWYRHLTGLDIVEINKEQVILVQDKLFKCQDNRRDLHKQLAVINHNLKDIYAELIQTKRDDPKYVQLTIMENRSLQDQSRISVQLNLLEGEEKDHFTQLATAIKEYHDSQTMNAQNYKYLSIIVSALVAIVSLIGSMIYNHRRIADMRIIISKAQEETSSKLDNLSKSLESLIDNKFTAFFKINESKKINASIEQPTLNVENLNNESPSTEAGSLIGFGMILLSLYILGKMIM